MIDTQETCEYCRRHECGGEKRSNDQDATTLSRCQQSTVTEHFIIAVDDSNAMPLGHITLATHLFILNLLCNTRYRVFFEFLERCFKQPFFPRLGAKDESERGLNLLRRSFFAAHPESRSAGDRAFHNATANVLS